MKSAPSRPSRTTVRSQLLHDLRTPLNQIIGYSEMLSEDAAAQPSGPATDLDRITAAGRRMLALIEENFIPASDRPAEPQPLNEPSRNRAPDEDAPLRPASDPGVLLVVDDDATNREVLSRRLRRQGHVVKTASNGRDALMMVREEAFDLVLLDIMMPDTDGYHVLAEMKEDERLRHVPVIMISALSEVQSVVRCIEAGAEDYLTKPFDPILLRARIAASLDKKRGRDREAALFEQLRENYGRLQELEKLRDDMRNMIVHDLRTPLTGVMASMDMLERYGALNPAQREMIAIAGSGGKTLLGMINDLLDVEKMESGAAQLDRQAVSVTSLVTAAARQVITLAEMEGTTITMDVPEDLPPLVCDAGMLSRTLVNLMANAIKFTGAGTVAVIARRAGRGIAFAIHDTGQGIPAEAFGRIFEKFGQVDRNSRVGTGLGLAFCKLAVEAHGGTIRVESTPGEGSTFSFSIPL